MYYSNRLPAILVLILISPFCILINKTKEKRQNKTNMTKKNNYLNFVQNCYCSLTVVKRSLIMSSVNLAYYCGYREHAFSNTVSFKITDEHH